MDSVAVFGCYAIFYAFYITLIYYANMRSMKMRVGGDDMTLKEMRKKKDIVRLN